MAKTFPLPVAATLDRELGLRCPMIYLDAAFSYFTIGDANALENLWNTRIATHVRFRRAGKPYPLPQPKKL